MRVFISGIGVIAPTGIGRENNWNAICESKVSIEGIPQHWQEGVEFRSTIWAPLPTIDFLQAGFRKIELLQRDPVSLLSVVTTEEALKQAGLEPVLVNKKLNQYALPSVDSERVAINFGIGMGGGYSILSNHASYILLHIKKRLKDNKDALSALNQIEHSEKINPFVVPRLICNSVPASIGMKYNIHGNTRPTVQACSSGTTALGQACQAIKSGRADLVISGGAEYLHDDHGAFFYGFDVARTLATVPEGADIGGANRPFDKDRNGFLFAEGGAATLILESEEHLEKRGGKPIAEIVGFGETFDAYSIMAPEPSGKQIERMMRMALDDAGITPDEVDYINAHGTGTIANDKTEAAVIERVFGKNVAVNSTKSIIGHTIGASGAIEAAVCALSLRDQELHPSLNLENPIADLDFVTERRKAKLKYAFSESFAFGGHNSGLVFKAV